jgi:hypothetical protein
MSQRPLVFIIDIDGTLIGNVSPQLCIYDLKQTSNLPLRYSFKELFQRFDQGLLRPYFDTFYKSTKRRLPNAEFYVYTASDDRWGLFITAALEKHLGIRFNRPVFTRKHCFSSGGSITKSLSNILPTIKRSLARKYGKNLDLDNRVMVIDNSCVFPPNEKPQHMVCPSYSCSVPENLPAIIDERTYTQHRATIEQTIRKYIPALANLSMPSYKSFEVAYYTYYINALRQCKTQDRFWFFLARLMEIKNITALSPRAIAYMNNKLSKRIS